jgi:predicted metal-dependent hydrolase
LKLLRPVPERETRTSCLDGNEVSYTLVRCRRRSIGLKVDGDGLTVRIPVRASNRWLESVLREHTPWILRKLEEWSRRPRRIVWDECALFPLFGREYTLVPEAGGGVRMVEAAAVQLALPLTTGLSPQLVERHVTAWYKAQALTCFPGRVALYAQKLGVPAPPVRLSSARSLWGSCNHATGIRLSWRLAAFPLRLVDYVVAHEVAHLVEMNHSSAFWRTVGRLYPDYETARRELHELGNL